MKKFIMTLDEGTTSARTVLFSADGQQIAAASREFTQIYPQPGMVEHDPLEIYSAQYSTMTDVVIKAGISPDEIAAIGITNQRETTVVWDKATGEPVCNAIVWQCRRTAEICEKLIADGKSEMVSSITGLKPDAYFSATKLQWILDRIPDARSRAERGELLFGTVDSWLLWKLSNGKLHATDRTNAARTMLYNIHRLCWDEELLRLFDIPACMLPGVYPSGHDYGTVEFMGADVPVCGIAGDQQAALFGQRCWSEGQIKNTYGTGCFLLMNSGNRPYQSRNGLLTTLAATVGNEAPQYALEGSVFIGGAVIQWLRDELRMISTAAESEECALRVDDTSGVYIVPAFSGLGAPYWDMHARGSIFGLTRGSNRDHIVRAALESIAYQSDDLIRALRADTGLPIAAIRADGGAAANSFLMQFQSDLSGADVIAPDSHESTAQGAAFLAGLTCGFWSREQLLSAEEPHRLYSPAIDEHTRAALRCGWESAVAGTREFTKE